MLGRLISSHLKTLTTISSTPQSPSPTVVAVSFFSRHFSTQTDAIKNKVDDAMPITNGNERQELQAELEGREIVETDHPVGPFGPKAMARVSVMNDALKSMYNAEERGERQVMIKPASKVVIGFLLVMQKHGYIGKFEYVDDHRKIVVELNGRLNKCGVISPRFNVGVKEIEGLTARLLPSREFGYIVLTTTVGIMDHEEARRKNVGGKVIGFFY